MIQIEKQTIVYSAWPLLVVLVMIFLTNCKTMTIATEESLLSEMANKLNNNIPEFKEQFDPKGFYIRKDKPVNFFVYDLIDTTANEYPNTQRITPKDNGIYHFAPVRFRYAFSHIGVIIDSEMKVFSFINCNDQGHSLNEVIAFVRDKQRFSDRDIDNLINYRHFGKYYATDSQTNVLCN